MKKHVRFQKTIRIAPLLLILAIFFSIILPVSASAEEEQKTVRVGYVNVPTYEEGGEGEYKRGAGYEYLQKISYITGWKYEYVYGSFKECFDMLTKGDIDLFGNVSYTPERSKLFFFSTYPQGKDTYFLYMTREKSQQLKGDVSKLSQSKVGVTEGSYQEGLLRSWIAENNMQTQVEYFNGYASLMAALDSGLVDAIAATNLSTSYDYSPILSIGFSDYYFAVSKSRPDLLKEINEALYEIQNTELDYNNLLVSRYQNVMSNSLLLSEKEEAWLSDHDRTLKMGYLANNLPYSLLSENGQMRGVMRALADTLEQEFGITVETKSYDTSTELNAALEQGEVDTIGPKYADFYLAELMDYVLTNTFLSGTPVLLFKDTNVDTSHSTIAVSNESLFSEEVVGVLYPDAKIYLCQGIEECLDAVVSRKADCTLVSSMRLNLLRQYPAMDTLQFWDTGAQAGICLATTKANRVAASILNKGINIASNRLSGVVLAENSYVERTVTFSDFVKDHMMEVIVSLGLIILILGIMIQRLLVNGKRLSAALAEAEREKEYAYNLNLSNSQLQVQVNQDSLTKIGNRHFCLESIRQLLTAKESFALCYCDLDNLKLINDQYGHTEGDSYIHNFVQIVQGQIRAGDIFARIGGDEFCIILRGCKYDVAAKKVQQMQKLFHHGSTEDYPKNFSCGIVEVPENHEPMDVKELLKKADAMMYRQKEQHKQNHS